MKNIKLLAFAIIAIFLFTSNVNAKIKSVEINGYIEENGDLSIEEIWNVYNDTGTEMYKSYGALDNYKITNLKVRDISGKEYTDIGDWNINASFDSKKFKSGINYTNDGLELCWGISEYKDNTYYISYKIKNFVFSLNDSQGVNFSLWPSGSNVTNEVIINLQTHYGFNESNTEIWAFGYEGDIQFVENKIVMNSQGPIYENDYMALLVHIKENNFNTSRSIDKTFDEIYNEAMVGVPDGEKEDPFDDEYYENNNDSSFFSNIFSVIATMFFPFVVIISIIFGLKNSGKVVKFKNVKKEFPKGDALNYYRDIPCNKNIFRAYFIAKEYGIIHEKSNIIGAIILKWMKEKKIKIIKEKDKKIKFKDNNYSLDLSKDVTFSDEREEKLFIYLRAASEDGILEAKEFEVWIKSNYTKIDKWYTDLDKIELDDLQKIGYVEENRQVTEIFKREAINILGFKKFLLDFSIINKREAIEVVLWEDFLIFANILGIADKVEEQFSNIYPDYYKQFSNPNYDISTVIIARSFAYNMIRTVEASHPSSSGGGFSSGGGGGSFSGGGFSSGGGGFSGGGAGSR